MKPTQEMANQAQQALDWRKEFKRGGTSVGVARANQLVRRDNLSQRTILRMYSFFSRHEGQFEQIYQDYVRETGATKVVGIVETTRRYINKIIALNTDEFMGVALIAKDIRNLDKMAFSRYRSATIARTETHNAASFANQKVAQSMNIPQMQKQWLATNDDRTRGIHSAVSGTQLPMDEDFVVGGLPMSYPGDPKGGAKNVINCRCVLLYITPEDVLI